eukprot:m.234141 g.234141  ORF g.234141 m.234141 type:complete len:266 (+) comp40104_c0_seq5:65-862(+)
MSEELYLVDVNIKSMDALSLVPRLVTLNLHCNSIVRMKNMELLRSLRHLDLSSNNIRRMEGMDALVSLKTLNLSCNKLQSVEGLKMMTSLRRLNLSFNQIASVFGLSDQHGSSYSLQAVLLHGNRLRSLEHVIRSLSGLVNLKELTLKQNALCSAAGWRTKVKSALPGIDILDGMDRAGNAVNKNEDLDTIPGIDQYIEYLMSSSAAEESVDIATPHIDKVLQKYVPLAVQLCHPHLNHQHCPLLLQWLKASKEHNKMLKSFLTD